MAHNSRRKIALSLLGVALVALVGQVEAAEPTPSHQTTKDAVPTVAARRAAAARAVDVLAGKLRNDGLEHPSGDNGRVVVHATAGMALLAAGNTIYAGPHRAELLQCARYVNKHAGVDEWGNELWDQTTWGLTHGIIFFAELHSKANRHHQAELERSMQRLVDLLVEAQTDRGGWCHGQRDTKNALDYDDLTATTSLSLFALGLARRQGVEVPPETIDAGVAYLTASSDGRGRIGYSPREGQRGFAEPGRNAGAILALLAVGAGDHPQFPAMRRYLLRNLDEQLLTSHGSAQLALLQSAWACRRLGKNEWQRYWVALGPTIIKLQEKDGSFSAPEAADRITEHGDRATATFALILLTADD